MRYKAEHPRDWDIYELPFTYAYNTQVHSLTSPQPFSLMLSRQTLPPTTIVYPMALPTDTTANTFPQGLHARLLHQQLKMPQHGDKQMKTAQRQYEGSYYG